MPITLPDALSAIADRKEFAVRRNDGLVTINYLVQMPGTFDGIRADFRGITFDEATGECISRPLHKFFGVGQTAETQYNKLKDFDALIYEKLDGSLIHFFRHRGRVMAATRMGPGTVQAVAAHSFAERTGLTRKIEREIDEGYTPIFEYLSPRFPIVVRYPGERLVHLRSRHVETGIYRPYSRYPDHAREYFFRFSELIEELKDKQDFEGYVCWMSDGPVEVVKAKCNWYLERHRAFDMMLRPAYKLYQLALDGVMDDLIAVAQPQHRGSLERVWKEAQGDYLVDREFLEKTCDSLLPVANQVSDPALARKLFVEAVRQEFPGCLGPLMTLYDGKSPDKAIKARLMERYKRMYPDPIILGSGEDES